MLNDLYDTTITRLKIHAPANLQDDVRRELQHADWPESDSEQVVFVRKLSATAPYRDIGRLLLDQARHQIRYSNDSKNVIRFANRLEMLATLLADLANGVAAERWYWQRWIHLFRLSTSKALFSVLVENLTQLNALLEILARQQRLEFVWRNLAEEEAKQLIHELSWKNGYSVPGQAIKTTAPAVPLQIPYRILQRWQKALSFEPTSNRFKLAILLIAQECAPLALLKSADSTLSAITESLEKLQNNDRPPTKPQGQDMQISEESNNEIIRSEPETEAFPAGKNLDKEQQHPPESELHDPLQLTMKTTENHRSSAKENSGEKVGRASDESIASPVYPGDNEQKHKLKNHLYQAPEKPISVSHPLNRIKIQIQPETAISQQFNTEQGGVLYLLNFLNRQPLQTMMEEHWQELPSGWIWLCRLAEFLNFNEQEPMAGFLLEQLGLESWDALAELPSLPERQQIEILAEQWYGKVGVWTPSLLSLPARIRYNASHIDMYSALSNVRLDLRLAGLDVNPGWIPWLGRVVQFHFDQHEGGHYE